MGWTGYQPTHFKKGGIVDRKAECDAYFMEGLNRGNFQVLKSSIKGSVYYAAVKDMVRYIAFLQYIYFTVKKLSSLFIRLYISINQWYNN